MSTRVGLISDPHAAYEPVRDALRLFREKGVETILCAGDIAGYGSELAETVDVLVASGCRSILGNHDLWYFDRRGNDTGGAAADFLRSLPSRLELVIEGCRLSMVHASPPDSVMNGIRLLDEEGKMIATQRYGWADALDGFPAEVLIVGHTHQVFAEKLGELLVINPGSTLFNHTCAILTLPEQEVCFYPLSGKEPVPSWNFSMFSGSF